MLIEIKHGIWINTDSIVSVKESGRGDEREVVVEVETGNGESYLYRKCTTSGHELAKVMAPLIPALPGYFVLWICDDDDEYEVQRTPIPAWRLSPYGGGTLEPVLTDDLDDVQSQGILDPTGCVTCPATALFDSEAKWIEHVREFRSAQLMRQAAATPLGEALE